MATHFGITRKAVQWIVGRIKANHDRMELTDDIYSLGATDFSANGNTVTETFGNRKIVTKFVSDTQIVQELYEDDTIVLTKTIDFSNDGLSIRES